MRATSKRLEAVYHVSISTARRPMTALGVGSSGCLCAGITRKKHRSKLFQERTKALQIIGTLNS